MNILIISGGDSSERKISLISAKQVRVALLSKNHKVKLFDLRDGYEALREINQNFDVVFPVLHGEEGEGGELQKFLSTLNVPFVGGDGKGFKEAWYKISFKMWCDQNGILTPKWKEVHSEEDIISFGFPCVLKASNGGSSKEVAILKSGQDINTLHAQSVLKLRTPLFVEEFIEGVELTVAILNNKALPILEIRPPEGEWFDYKNKYSGRTEKIVDSDMFFQKEKEKIQQIALYIHQQFNLGSYSRIDFLTINVHPGGVQAFAVDVNVIPGLTPESLFPKAAKAVGLDFPELMDYLVKLALKDHDKKSSI